MSNELILASQNICELNKVPKSYRNITSLNLKNNSLKDLGEIGQFKKLKKLNLQDNQIAEIEEVINKLKSIKTLEEISLEGNPVIRNTFNFASKLIIGLENIKMVNSQRITKEGREKAIARVQREEQQWRQIIKKHMEIIKEKGFLLGERRGVDDFDANEYRKSKERKLIARYLCSCP
eukprot:TRINITY_DN8091_c0_g1_i3.p1 TRINITY_DN8091_c0_g1~~TRINITY_DN8091_c0_g1_i3.p1  ORF type:complete len:178 (-),score=28.68 TRINITY_DN8091_c0_g1_i3:286-819(-)